MAVYRTTDIKDPMYMISQTPPDLVDENYYISELQKKVDVDWKFRPNRCNIEIENGFGKEEYLPLEVVIQTIKNDKGEAISKDHVRIVFRDIRRKEKIGQRYKFSYLFGEEKDDAKKSIWIAVNRDEIIATSSQSIQRCNGSIASIYTDADGNNYLHYEPVIQSTKLSSPDFDYSAVAIDPNGLLNITAQYNKYTKQYYINQRFIIGINKVYKVVNILASDSQTTFDPEDVGIIKIYLDIDQSSELDNFETRLAHNGIKDEPIIPKKDGEYSLAIIDPTSLPDNLTTFKFKPQVLLNGEEQTGVNININCELKGTYANKAALSDFVTLSGVDSDGYYTLQRIKQDPTMKVKVTCEATIGEQNLQLKFEMRLFG